MLPHSIQQAFEHAGRYIETKQMAQGEIPWFTDGKLDPWDHCEAIMGLNLAGQVRAAQRGFTWLESVQNTDGSWYAKYLGDKSDGDLDRVKIETNFVAYPATALWHYYLITRDQVFVEQTFPAIERAINFVLAQQGPEGEIQWAISDQEELPLDSLITASASILRSIECAIKLADSIGKPNETWQESHQQLSNCLKQKPWRFDRTWESKERFSMDWFYPILSGVYSEDESRLRLNERWKEFILDDFGCKCVSDEPWVTIAETCEFIMALVASNQQALAEKFLRQLLRWQDKDGGFWTGYVVRDSCIWPQEKTTWTAAAFMMACDAVYKLSPAQDLFTDSTRERTNAIKRKTDVNY
ncbi:MAG: hypothetical protein ACI93R_001418 [Flavobacteriales bacterium]|jgi:hypothetical protein